MDVGRLHNLNPLLIWGSCNVAIKVSSVCVGTEPDELNFQKFGKEKGRDETGGTRNMIR